MLTVGSQRKCNGHLREVQETIVLLFRWRLLSRSTKPLRFADIRLGFMLQILHVSRLSSNCISLIGMWNDSGNQINYNYIQFLTVLVGWFIYSYTSQAFSECSSHSKRPIVLTMFSFISHFKVSISSC
jgi:hypothetical protein